MFIHSDSGGLIMIRFFYIKILFKFIEHHSATPEYYVLQNLTSGSTNTAPLRRPMLYYPFKSNIGLLFKDTPYKPL